MLKINVPPSESRQLESIEHQEIKINIPAEKVTIMVYNKTSNTQVTITETATKSMILVTVEDPPQTEFRLEPIWDDLRGDLVVKGPWDVEGYCFYCCEANTDKNGHKPDCLWLRINQQ